MSDRALTTELAAALEEAVSHLEAERELFGCFAAEDGEYPAPIDACTAAYFDARIARWRGLVERAGKGGSIPVSSSSGARRRPERYRHREVLRGPGTPIDTALRGNIVVASLVVAVVCLAVMLVWRALQ